MKPLACTNTQPGIPLTLESSSSLRPHHSERRGSLQVCACVREKQYNRNRDREGGERERRREREEREREN